MSDPEQDGPAVKDAGASGHVAEEVEPLQPAPEPGMAESWNRRATTDALFYIASGTSTSEEDFARSGEDDVRDTLLDGIELLPEARVLEIGCGIGRILVPLARRAASVHGVDISDVMIERSKEFCAGQPNITTSVTDGSLAGFEDGSFDLVLSFIVFQHVPEREAIAAYVAEAARVLADGGVFRFQVDGRASGLEGPANSYDGVKLSRGEVAGMVTGAGLAILDDWGDDTHYYWTTARKGGGSAASPVRVSPRAFDPVMLEDFLRRAGAANVGEVVSQVCERTRSLRSCVRGLEQLWPDDHGMFVQGTYELFLGRFAREDELAFHLRVLARGWDTRDSVIDSIVTSAETRDLLSPVLHGTAWPRIENAVAALGSKEPRRHERDVFRLAELVANALQAGGESETLDAAYKLVRGRAPDSEGRHFHVKSTLSHPAGRYLLVRRLLNAPDDRARVAPPPPGVVASLAARCGPRRPDEAAEAEVAAGESFTGERHVARAILDASEELPDAEFIARAYALVLGRPVDDEGAAYYAGLLESGRLGRPSLVRDLLWSDELRLSV